VVNGRDSLLPETKQSSNITCSDKTNLKTYQLQHREPGPAKGKMFIVEVNGNKVYRTAITKHLTKQEDTFIKVEEAMPVVPSPVQ
jgi:hypothetical protein